MPRPCTHKSGRLRTGTFDVRYATDSGAKAEISGGPRSATSGNRLAGSYAPPFEARVSSEGDDAGPISIQSPASPRARGRSSMAVMIRFQTTRPFRPRPWLPSDYRCAPKEPEIGVPCRPSVPEKVPAVSGAPLP